MFYPEDYAQLANDIYDLSSNVIAMAITYQESDDQWVKEYHQIQRHARMKGKLRGQAGGMRIDDTSWRKYNCGSLEGFRHI